VLRLRRFGRATHDHGASEDYAGVAGSPHARSGYVDEGVVRAGDHGQPARKAEVRGRAGSKLARHRHRIERGRQRERWVDSGQLVVPRSDGVHNRDAGERGDEKARCVQRPRCATGKSRFVLLPPAELRERVVQCAGGLFSTEPFSHEATLRLGPPVQAEQRGVRQRLECGVDQHRSGPDGGHADGADANVAGVGHGLAPRCGHALEPVSRVVLGDTRAQPGAPVPATSGCHERAVVAHHGRAHAAETDIDAEGPLAHTRSDITR
jgi:hypothetical protein